MKHYVIFLFEHAAGYALISSRGHNLENILENLNESSIDFETFSSRFKLKAFSPFSSAENALDNCNCVSEGIVHSDLQELLRSNLSENAISLYICDRKLAESVKSPDTGLPKTVCCSSESSSSAVFRKIRQFFPNYISELSYSAESQAQIGLGHSYSRAKVKFNVNRDDNMVMHTICLLDQMDKDINTFAMRIKEWFSYHFPELSKIVPESSNYIRLVNLLRSRNETTIDKLQEIMDIIQDADKSRAILSAAETSIGFDIADEDIEKLALFTEHIRTFLDRRTKSYDYLVSKLNGVAPNLNSLIGSQVAARLINHAGSLTNLAKFPASTIQILGAEKALFRALRTRGRTPKYGLIFHSAFIGRAEKQNKGRISRFLAAKCALASRIDCFSEVLCDVYGQHLRKQVEDRLNYFETGEMPITNAEAMSRAVIEANKVIKKLKKRAIKTLNCSSSPNLYTPSNKVKKNKQVVEKETYKEISEENANVAGSQEVLKNKKSKKRKLSEIAIEAYGDTEIDASLSSPKSKKRKRALSEVTFGSNFPNTEQVTISAGEKNKNKSEFIELEDGMIQQVWSDHENSQPEAGKKKKRKRSSSERFSTIEALEESTIELNPTTPTLIKKKKKKKILNV